MAEQSIQKLMEAEKARLDKEEVDLNKQIEALQDKIAGIQKQRDAIDAYHDALAGKKRKPTQVKGERRTGVRESVLNVIKSSPSGIKAGDIVKNVGAQGDAAHTKSVYQALAALKRDNKLTSVGGLYKSM